MGDSLGSYRSAMRDAWHGWWINWPLSQRVRVGDVLDTSGGTIRPAGDLTKYGVAGAAAAAAPPADFLYDANGSAQVTFKLSGTTPPGFSALAQADAGALVSFKGDTSVLALFTGLTQDRFADTRAVAGNLVKQFWNGVWAPELAGVTDVVTAAAGTVLAASDTDASAELRVDATVGAGPLKLADLAGNVAVARSSRVGLEWSGTEVTPFYRVFRLRRTWLHRVATDYGPRQPGRGAAPEAVPPLLVDEARDDPDAVLEPL
ncbi:hypothetical protein ACWT_1906 [Actinoplanes sp. SE50]|uniref:hypothetical protein n=1 Tax=unclassified Actinoplanes TaxID=2626549 RepID=UPI00023EBEAF|nr:MULTISPECIES: hypothetical protein [unclassified Actinoplanes]AEV82925.1 hypothetical protein ACPL_2028 [Actinoplanes sp. SE50/110]ATO81321.1 hypothetical protein ACWT_1906 [Actinoplanes sp. SE50]SLL98728.1 hypothetical protein ACSP50_1955 [Actinoplanes sp. SE50/110]